jgi:FkbM family methyltransferase
VIYSCGVGDDISFDLSLVERYGVTIHGFDPTPKSIAWVRSQCVPHAFRLHEYGIADFDGKAVMYPPANPEFVSYSILASKAQSGEPVVLPVRRVATVMGEMNHARIDVLKMDIEGSEYPVIHDLLASHVDVRQILVEFHDRFPSVGRERTREAIAALLDGGYKLFNIEEDNYSFVRD